MCVFFKHKFQIYNYDLSVSQPLDIYGQLYGTGTGYTNYLGGGGGVGGGLSSGGLSGSLGQQQQLMPSYNSYETTNLGGLIGVGGGSSGLINSIGLSNSDLLYGRNTSPLPRRRYSIGGLPSASMADYCSLTQTLNQPTSSSLFNNTQQQHHNNTPHITNLLNETSKSISRSSQILNRRSTSGSGGIGGGLSTGGLHSSITNLDCGRSSYPALNLGEIFLNNNISHSSNIDNNIVPLSSNFYSHPNIYTQPNNFCSSNTNLTNLNNLNYFDYKFRPSSDYLYTSKPIYSNTYSTTTTLPTTQKYSHYNYPTSSHNVHHNSLPFNHNHNYHHHSSNPTINNYHSQQFNQQHQQQSHQQYNHQQQPLHHQPTTTTSFNGYSNQHFDHHHYNRLPMSMSKLDLDFTKPPEVKRQVSFKFDVDTLSIDS